MRKLKLDLDALQVERFEVQERGRTQGRGTVRGHSGLGVPPSDPSVCDSRETCYVTCMSCDSCLGSCDPTCRLGCDP